MNSYLHVLNRICEDVQQNMAKLNETEEIEWTVNVEILLFYAMIGHKPVGVNRHFMMLFIHHKFSTYVNRQISSKVIWDHLDSMYDMAALHESEIVPFPNHEVDFELPEDCYDLVYNKFGVSLHPSSNENETPKNAAKVAKKLNTSKVKQNSTPVNNTKTNFVTPVVSKPPKNVSSRSETKPAVLDSNSKVKQESSLSKMNKIKRSSSPFSKNVKNEPSVTAKEDSLDVPMTKKVNKHERSSSPAAPKKVLKAETNSSNNAVKKPIKVEQNLNVIKQGKVEPLDSAGKKVKTENISKKGKVSTSTESSSKKNVKLESNNIRKKYDSETHHKKSSDSTSKVIKSDVKTSSNSSKGPKLEEADASVSSGSRKSSTSVKIENSDSVKKQKRQKLSESAKKPSSTKRRRS